MTTHDEPHERHRDELQDRREFQEVKGRPAHGGDGRREQLIAFRTDRMELTVVPESEHPDRVALSVIETRTGGGFSVSLTALELEVLAFGLGRVAARVQREDGRR
jgi:hypothetical protein